MNVSFRSSVGRFAFALLAGVALASPASAQTPQERAAQHALNGPEIKKLKVLGHEFNVKKAQVSDRGTSVTIVGQLSHHLSFRPDDQIYYTIRKSGGRVTAVDIKIDRGGLAPYASKLVNHFLGQQLVADKVEELVRSLGRRVDGSWESAADLIVATIALRSPGNAVTPTTRPQTAQPRGNTPPVATRPTVSDDGAVRDHRTPRAPVVRDHRGSKTPMVRDHRRPGSSQGRGRRSN